MANRINFQVGYTVDKAGLNEIQNALRQVQIEANKAAKSGTLTTELKEASKAAQQLQTILNNAWNSKLNQLDLSKLNNSIKTAYGSVEQLRASFTLAGNAGSTGAATAATAYNKFASSVLNTNLQLKQSNKLLDEMATTMSNTIKWGVTSSIFNSITSSVQKAYTYTKNLDSSLNDIRIVTDKSAESMETFARQANAAAKALGASTLDYTQASLIYYQQGLSDKEAQARAETTLKAANVTGQTGEEVSEQLTAVWNGYKVTAEETEAYVDKLAAVAAATASDLEELSVGMSKVASAAAAMGVDVDKLNGMLSTVISVTRQAPESAGTAFKTIFARMEDLELDGEDEFGVSLGEVSSSLESMGVHILDATGSMRELGDVIEEVGNKWNSGAWSDAEKQALAIDLAGKRQYNNLLALFENWDMYNEAVNTSINAVGTLQHQQDIYMESTAAHLEQLRTEADKTYDILFDQDIVNSFTDAATGALEVFNNYLTGLNGGMNSIVHMGSVVANVFSNQIGKAINQSLINLDAYRANLDAINMKQQVIDAHAISGQNITNDMAIEKEASIASELLKVREALTSEQYNALTSEQQQIGLLEQEIQEINSYKDIAKEIFETEKATNAQYEVEITERELLLKDKEEEAKLTAEAYRSYQQGLMFTSEQTELEEERLALAERLSYYAKSLEQDSDIQTNTLAIVNSLLEGEEVNLRDIETILQQQTLDTEEQRAAVEQVVQALEHKKQAENGHLEQLQQEQQARQKIIDQTTEQAKRQQLLSQAVSGLMTVVSLMTTLSGIVQTLNNQDLTAGEKAQAIITTLLVSLPMIIMNFSNIAKIIPGVATGLSTVALSLAGVTGAELGATAATTSLTGAIGMLWTALAPILPIILAISAAIAAVIGIVYACVKAYNADADAAKEAAEIAKELKEAYDELKSSYESLKSSLADYTDARAGLDELIKGTDEWKEAVQSLNEQVLSLLDTYPELAKYITNNDGLLEISKKGQDALLEAQNEKVQEAYRSSIMAAANSNNKENASAVTDYSRSVYYYDPNQAMYNENYTGSQLSNEATSKVLIALEENGLSILENSKTLSEAADITETQAQAVLDNKEALLTLSDKVEANTQANTIYAQQLGQSLLENSKYAGSRYEEQLAQLVGQNANDLYSDKYADEYKDKWFGKTDKDIQKQYAELMGYEWQANKNGNKGEYLVNGELKTISDSVARAALAQAAAQEEASKDIEKYAQALEAVTNTTQSDSQNVSNALANLALHSDDLSELTAKEIEDLANSDFSKLSEDTLATLGFGSVEELEALRDKAVDTWNENVENITDDMAYSVQEAFAKVDTKDLSLAEMQNIADIFELASAYGKLDEAIEAYEAGTLEDFAEGIKKVENSLADFQEKYSAIHKFMDSVETGDTIDAEDYALLGEESQKYFTQMLDGTYKLIGSAEDFQKTTQQNLIDEAINQKDILSGRNDDLTKLLGYDFAGLSNNANYQNEQGENKYDSATVQQQIDLIRELGDQSDETKIKINQWQEQLNNGRFENVESLQEISDAVSGCSESFENLSETIQANNDEISGWDLAIAYSYDNMKDLKAAMEDGTISAEAFTQAAISLDEALDIEDLDSEELKNYADYLQEAAKNMEGFNDAMSDDEAKIVAKGIMKMNDAIDTLADNFKDWLDILQNSTESSEEYADAIINTKDAVADLLDVSSDFVSNDFILEHLDLIKEAATGSEEAIDDLKAALADNIIANILLNNELSDSAENIMADYQWLVNNLQDIEVGATVDDGDFVNKMNELITSANMTVEQVNALFDAMGFEANFATEEVPIKQRVPEYVTETVYDETRTQTMPDGAKMTWVKTRTHTYQDGFYEAEGKMDAIAMSTNGKTPVISGITKKASGSSNNYSSSNKGGKSPGKSGSSKKGKDPNKMDYLENTADRYHDINLELENLETNLNRLDKQQDKLYGQDLINNLNKQLDILEKQKDAYQAKLEIAKAEAQEVKNSLAMQGVTFDSDGYISNYASALQSKLNYVNSIIAQYNAMSAEEQEDFKETVEAAKKDYETFQSQIERYDELISSFIPDIEDALQDAVDKEIEINIQKFTMEVELRLDMAEAERDFNEFKRKVIDGIKDDDILGIAKSKLKDYTSYFNTEGTGIGSVQKLTDQINDTMEQIQQIDNNGWADVYGDNKAQAMEDLQKYYEELMQQLEDVEDLVDEIKESYLDMIDEAVEAFDKQVDQYEYIKDLLDHNMNVIGLVYGDKAYAQMAQYYEKIEKNNNQELDFLKKRVAYAEEMMNKETDPEAKEKWEEEWMDALEKLNEKVEDSIQNIIDKYQNVINQVFDELNKKVTNGKGLDYVNDEWDLINKNADQYLDTINSMYAIQDLENKYLEALDQTDSLSAQQKLNNMMNEQLGMLKDKDKLTQYDVDRANMMYEIALKQIALEEAQQNKSKMRLRRDSQGNYSYQFVSDEDSIAQAQQDLLAAQNDLYNLDKEKYKENLNEIYEYYVEFQEKYAEIMSDMSLTDEERQERAKLLQEQYGELINGLVEQNETIKQNLHESTFMALEGLYAADAESFREMTGKDIEAFRNLTDTEKDLVINDLIPQWDSGVQHMADVFAGEGGFIPTCKDAFEELDQATKDYQDSLDELENVAGIDFDAISEGYDENIEKAQDLLYANDDLINKYMEEIDAILDVISQLEDLIAKYEEAQAAAVAATEAAYAFVQAQKEASAAAAGDSSGSSSGGSGSSNKSGGSSSGSSSGNGGGSSGSGGDGVPKVGDVVTYTGGLYYYDSYGTKPTGSRGPGKKVTITHLNPSAPYPIHVQSSDSAYGWLKQSQISGYDTGGYTGDWGDDDGRLAILHKKELVLKDTDTENMLMAVGIVRDMASMLNNLNTNVMDRLFGLSTGLNVPMSSISAASDTLEQNVHIDASFPNVQNSHEIEDAFNNLVNIASQRANKTKR